MSLDVRRTVSGGLARALTRNGAVLMATFFLASVVQGLLVWVLATTYVPLGLAGSGVPAGTPAPGAALPSLVSAAAALLGGLTGGVLTVPIQVVAVRALVDDGRDHLPEQLLFRRLGWTTLRFFAASLLKIVAVFVLVFVGVIVVFLGTIAVAVALPDSLRATLVSSWFGPALLLAVGVSVALIPAAFFVLTFAFVEPEIAVRDESVPSAFVRSWRVVAGNRIRLGAAIVTPHALSLVLNLLVGQLGPEATLGSPTYLLSQAAVSLVTSVVAVLVLAITVQAWVQLTGVDGPLEEYWAGTAAGSDDAHDGAAAGSAE